MYKYPTESDFNYILIVSSKETKILLPSYCQSSSVCFLFIIHAFWFQVLRTGWVTLNWYSLTQLLSQVFLMGIIIHAKENLAFSAQRFWEYVIMKYRVTTVKFRICKIKRSCSLSNNVGLMKQSFWPIYWQVSVINVHFFCYRSFDSLTADLTRVLVDNVTLPSGVRAIYSLEGRKVSLIHYNY